MLSEDIKINDVIKVIPINIDYAKNAIHLDLNIESSKYLKFIEHYEGKIIKGILLKDKSDNIIVILSCNLYAYELYGNTNYLMKISKNMNSNINN